MKIVVYLWQKFPSVFSDHINSLQYKIYDAVLIEIGKIDSGETRPGKEKNFFFLINVKSTG